MTPAPLHFVGERVMLDPTGALFWPAERTLVVADLHFEKGSSAAEQGRLLPPWDTAVTLERLAGLLRRYAPARVLALGDSFHDRRASTRLSAADATRLRALTQRAAFVWVLGNHDPDAPDLPGEAVADWRCGPLWFRHEAVPGAAAGEIVGHHHPKAQVPVRGALVTRPCFVTDPKRIMLPALGAYTGGLDVRHPAIARLFPRGGRVFLLGRERLFSFTTEQIRQAAAAPPAHPAVTHPDLGRRRI